MRKGKKNWRGYKGKDKKRRQRRAKKGTNGRITQEEKNRDDEKTKETK